ncbi:MAG TPA: glycosyl hydrolase family 18 protein, partial [Dehalococcoidia bacterium]|nr:glycosyl hydrolase family 18 protein [Dehalococcoidia bacterium]
VRGTLERLPPNLAVMRNVNFGFQVQGWLPPGTEVEPEAASLLTVLNPIDYHPAADGSVTGIPTEIATAGNFAIAPTIVAGTEDEISALNAILGSGPLTAAHIDAIIALVEQGDYAGIDLDYRELDPSLGSQFTEFITALAARLHEQQRTLTITLPLPVRDSESWDTGPFDWTQLGETVDRIKIPTPDDQSIYAARMDDVLTFLTEQAPPSKMLLIVSPYSYVRVGEEITPVQLAEALSLATPVQIAEDESALVTGGTVTLVGTNLYRENNATGLQWDDTANMVTFAYQEGDTPTTVWLENQYSIGFKLQLVTRHRLGGIAVLDVSSNGLKANIWPPIRGMVEGGSLNLLKPNEQLLQPTWQIVDPNGQPVPDTALDGGMSGAVQWQIPATPGTYVVTLIVSDGTIRVGQEAQLLVAEGSAPSDAATAPADQPPDAADAPVDEPTLVPGDGGEPADTAVAE